MACNPERKELIHDGISNSNRCLCLEAPRRDLLSGVLKSVRSSLAALFASPLRYFLTFDIGLLQGCSTRIDLDAFHTV